MQTNLDHYLFEASIFEPQHPNLQNQQHIHTQNQNKFTNLQNIQYQTIKSKISQRISKTPLSFLNKQKPTTKFQKKQIDLPTISNSSLNRDKAFSLRQSIVKKKTMVTINQKQKLEDLGKDRKTVFKQSRSVQIQRKKEKIVKQQLFLPAFIRNFKLPPKQKVQVIQTMDTFKKRESVVVKYLSPIQTLKKYKILSHIGKGSYSIVSLAIDTGNAKKYAIKTYTKLDQIQDFQFFNIDRQISSMLKLRNHKNVVSIEEVFLQKRKLLIIMENCGQLSLAGLVRKKRIIQENQAKNIFKQIIQGVIYCHQNDICHRDLKLENILIDQKNCIKIIDFGFSYNTGRMLSSVCGTPPYMSPQIVSKGLYDGKMADIWSVGVILYCILYGTFPFKSSNEKQLFRLIQQGKIIHNQSISIEAKQVINSMLKCKVSERATAEEVLKLKWLQT